MTSRMCCASHRAELWFTTDKGTEGDGRRGSFSPSVGDGAEVVIYSVLLQKSNVLMEAGAPEVIHLHHLCVLVDYEDEEIKED